MTLDEPADPTLCQIINSGYGHSLFFPQLTDSTERHNALSHSPNCLNKKNPTVTHLDLYKALWFRFLLYYGQTFQMSDFTDWYVARERIYRYFFCIDVYLYYFFIRSSAATQTSFAIQWQCNCGQVCTEKCTSSHIRIDLKLAYCHITAVPVTIYCIL